MADLVCYIKDIPVAIRDYTLCNCEVWIRSELVEWVYPSVANSDSLQVEIMMGIPVHEIDNSRDVMSSIRFSCYEKLTTFELWVSDEEMVHENVEVERYIILIPFKFPKALN